MRALVAWGAEGASPRYRADRARGQLCAGLVSRPRPQGDAGRNRPGLARLSAVRLPPHAAPVAAQSTLAGEESLVRSGPGSARPGGRARALPVTAIRPGQNSSAMQIGTAHV